MDPIKLLSELPNLHRDLFFGGLGALLLLMYQVYGALPDIQASMVNQSEDVYHLSSVLRVLLIIILKLLISVLAGAMVSAFLIRPDESYGAILAGMTWTAAIRSRLEG